MEYIKPFVDFINEYVPQTVDVSNSNGITDEYLYDLMKQGKKEVMFLNTLPGNFYRAHNKSQQMYQDMAKKDGFKEITFPNDNGGTVIIIHADNGRAKKKAQKLAQIAKSRGGFLADKTPEEAREIGRLLDYRESDIERYINRHYT